MHRMGAIAVTALLLILLLPACRDQDASNVRTIRVFAAASLTDAFTEIASTYEAQHEGVQVELSFAASSTLTTQIEEGAPADVFASANLAQMERLQNAGLLDGTPQVFARNAPVIIVHRATGIQDFEGLVAQNATFVLAAPEVPIRVYTDQILQQFADGSPALQALAAHIPAHLVSEEPDVRQVVVKVALGEADAGIAYATDITPEVAAQLTALPIPQAQNVIAAYPIAAVSGSSDAADFIAFVLSDAGQAVLQTWGFLPADA